MTSPNGEGEGGVQVFFFFFFFSSSIGISREDDLPKPGEDEDSSPPRSLEKSDVEISFHALEVLRQNVNKVNTKVDMRYRSTAPWFRFLTHVGRRSSQSIRKEQNQ